jgi:hypothetical protein
LYSSPAIIRQIKSRRMRWEGYVARMGEEGKEYRVMVGKPEGKRSLGTPRRRWEDGIGLDLWEICDAMEMYEEMETKLRALKLCSKRKEVVSFTFRLLYPARKARRKPTHWTAGWVGIWPGHRDELKRPHLRRLPRHCRN